MDRLRPRTCSWRARSRAGVFICQIMTAVEFEREIIDFTPLLTFLVQDFENDTYRNTSSLQDITLETPKEEYYMIILVIGPRTRPRRQSQSGRVWDGEDELCSVSRGDSCSGLS